MREVSDSLHLRRFCLIPLEEEVPDESTVRKLTRRLGAETVAELSRVLIGKAQRETRFAGAGRADRLRVSDFLCKRGALDGRMCG